MNRYIPVCALLLVFTLGACSTVDLYQEAETPEQQYYVTLNVFNEYDRAALEIAQNPNTPTVVRDSLKKARTVAKEALVLADVAYGVLQDARAALRDVPNQTAFDEVAAAATAFQNRMGDAFAKVNNLKNAVEEL